MYVGTDSLTYLFPKILTSLLSWWLPRKYIVMYQSFLKYTIFLLMMATLLYSLNPYLGSIKLTQSTSPSTNGL